MRGRAISGGCRFRWLEVRELDLGSMLALADHRTLRFAVEEELGDIGTTAVTGRACRVLRAGDHSRVDPISDESLRCLVEDIRDQ